MTLGGMGTPAIALKAAALSVAPFRAARLRALGRGRRTQGMRAATRPRPVMSRPPATSKTKWLAEDSTTKVVAAG